MKREGVSMKIVLQIKDTAELVSTAKRLSIKHGGAWSWYIMPFSHETHFRQFKSPSKVPDSMLDDSRNRIAYKGKIQEFTPAAQYREQQRGYNADR